MSLCGSQCEGRLYCTPCPSLIWFPLVPYLGTSQTASTGALHGSDRVLVLWFDSRLILKFKQGPGAQSLHLLAQMMSHSPHTHAKTIPQRALLDCSKDETHPPFACSRRMCMVTLIFSILQSVLSRPAHGLLVWQIYKLTCQYAVLCAG